MHGVIIRCLFINVPYSGIIFIIETERFLDKISALSASNKIYTENLKEYVRNLLISEFAEISQNANNFLSRMQKAHF